MEKNRVFDRFPMILMSDRTLEEKNIERLSRIDCIEGILYDAVPFCIALVEKNSLKTEIRLPSLL